MTLLHLSYFRARTIIRWYHKIKHQQFQQYNLKHFEISPIRQIRLRRHRGLHNDALRRFHMIYLPAQIMRTTSSLSLSDTSILS